MLKIDIHDSDMWNEIHQEHVTIPAAIKVNEKILSEIAQEVKLRKIRSVILVGRGSSEHAEQVAKYFFEVKCGMFVEIFSPSVITLYQSKLDFSDKLVIGISQCGEAKDVWTVLQTAQKQGAITVSITNANPCTMSQIDKYYVNLGCGKELSFTAAKSYLSQTALLVSLGAMIAGDTDYSNQLNNVDKLISDCYQPLERDILQAIPLFRNVSDIMIVGRGYSYAVALETELKIQEASYTSGRAYSSADYQHGPISTTNRYTPFIFFLTDAETDTTTVQLLQKLQKDFHISTMVVTNKPEYYDLGDYCVKLPESCEGAISVFGLAIFSQLFACILSFARGFNPDKPTGLSKVTVTY